MAAENGNGVSATALYPVGPGDKGDRLPKILSLIEKGWPKVTAAQACGVSVTTLWKWEQTSPAVAEALAKADSDAEGVCVDRIYQHAHSPDERVAMQALTFIMERRWAERWGRRVLEHVGAEGGPIALDLTFHMGRASAADEAV